MEAQPLGLNFLWRVTVMQENKPVVLVVEDDKPIRSFITVSLELEG